MTPSDCNSALLEARGLAFARRDLPIFGPLDFAVCAGEVVLIEGVNGSGKTTLLRVLAGLLAVRMGAVTLHGETLTRDRAAGEIVLLGHNLGLKSDLTALENLRFACGLYGQRRGTEPGAALAGVGLDGYQHEQVQRLSAGQKKRVALARLWLVPAALWLLDEPWTNLDGEGIATVNRLLERHVGGGGAALVTHHGGPSHLRDEPRRIQLGAIGAAA